MDEDEEPSSAPTLRSFYRSIPAPVAPPPEPEPVDLAQIAVIESVIDPQAIDNAFAEIDAPREGEAPAEPRAVDDAVTINGSAGASPSPVAIDIEPVTESVPEEIAEVTEPTNRPPVTIAEDLSRLFIPDGFPIDDAPLPPEIHHFAPWTWSWTEIAGVGLTIGSVLSAGSLWVWYVFQ